MTGDFNIVKLKIYEKSARKCNRSQDENKVLYLCALENENEDENENSKQKIYG